MATMFIIKTWGFNSQVLKYTTSMRVLYKWISKQYKKIDTQKTKLWKSIHADSSTECVAFYL